MDPKNNDPLQDLLGRLKGTPARPASAAPPPEAPPPRFGGEDVGELSRKVEELATELAESRARTIEAMARLHERERVEKEMEAMFQDLRSQNRLEEARRLEREIAAKLQVRIESLESKLDSAWARKVEDLASKVERVQKALGAGMVRHRALKGVIEDVDRLAKALTGLSEATEARQAALAYQRAEETARLKRIEEQLDALTGRSLPAALVEPILNALLKRLTAP